MTDPKWGRIAARITSQCAVDIDAIIGAFDPRRNDVGRDLYPETAAVLRGETRMKDENAVAIGIRIADVPDSPADLAMRLAALALEQDVEVIVLSHIDYSGLERFGFRCERVAGETEAARAACSATLCRFWNIEMVI